jgi:hypothetical protein
VARTNSKAVREVLVLGGNLEEGACPNLDRLIRIAGSVVDRVATCSVNKGYTLTSAQLQDMETLLAAQLYADPRGFKTSESIGRSSVSYDRGKSVTSYKDMATMMDPSGCLAEALAGNKQVGVAWLGSTLTEQTDYEDRN